MIEENEEHGPIKFDVHPSVVYRLGDELITDVYQALLELIKNSYDADATWVKVTVNSTKTLEEYAEEREGYKGSNYLNAMGSICIEDDGTGMDLQTIINGWLLVSNSSKRKFKINGRVTKRNRTPLGDKGLGRLGAQRLGNNIEIFTKTESSADQSIVSFSWNDFLDVEKLSDVPVIFKNEKDSRRQGTKVLITGLRDFDTWQNEQKLIELQKELSKLLSPYKKKQDFRLIVEVNGKKLELTEISSKVREVSPVAYRINFDENQLSIDGKVKLIFVLPNTSEGRESYFNYVDSDNGAAFTKFLLKKKKASTFNFKIPDNKKWLLEFDYFKEFTSLDNLNYSEEEAVSPGPFSGEVDVFDLSPGKHDLSETSIYDRMSEFRKYIKELSGVRVYRDGFNISVPHDWLNFGKSSTTGSSWYELKPETTLGYIDISAFHNKQLEETTDREGFKDTPAYRNFCRILNDFKDYANSMQEFIRRGYNEFIRSQREERLEKPCLESQDLTEVIIEKANIAVSHKQSLIEKKPKQLSIIPTNNEEEFKSLISYLDDISKLGDIGTVLKDRLSALKEQLAEMHETIGLGLTAEALSHEIFNISDNLTQKTKAIQAYCKKKEIKDFPILEYSEYVSSSTVALRKQVSHLSPSLRYVRDKKEHIQLSDFLIKILEPFYRNRFNKKDIILKIDCSPENDFSIYINRGKLTQIFDNLLLNSEYWLIEELRGSRIEKGIITIKVKDPHIIIEDNGCGIEPSIEDAVFEPFVTNKGSQKGQSRGRGLGLYIIRQLLDVEDCNIYLLPKRNKHKRLCSFQIDFRGAINDR